jgi:hypothetical protein
MGGVKVGVVIQVTDARFNGRAVHAVGFIVVVGNGAQQPVGNDAQGAGRTGFVGEYQHGVAPSPMVAQARFKAVEARMVRASALLKAALSASMLGDVRNRKAAFKPLTACMCN